MKVFHASNTEVKIPMLVESNRLLDFGPGFYTTDNYHQAVRFAESVVRHRGGTPVLNVYEFDEKAIDDLIVKRFESPSSEWLDFVSENRTGRYAGIKYDLVAGPVANDNVYAAIGLYLKGFMSKEATIQELRVHSLYNQIVFCQPSAFAYLKYIGKEVL